jgi:predicted  nucleic acid-binding Zn-ribbon protein
MSHNILQLQSQLREAESNYARLDKDSSRIAMELEFTKANLQEKESTLKSNMTSMHEMQKSLSDERGSLRSELK